METFSESNSSEKSNALKAILFGGLLAGVLDLTAACMSSYLTNGVNPVRVFQAIASGLLGAESYKGGAWTAVFGVFLHFVIAFGAAVVYFAVSRKFKFLINQAVISGVIYGIAVFWFMQLVVLPLSAFQRKNPFELQPIIIGLVIHILFVGLPIALVISHYSKNDSFNK